MRLDCPSAPRATQPLAYGLLLFLLGLSGCSQAEPFDSVGYVQDRLREESKLSELEASRLAVPFSLSTEAKEELSALLSRNGSERFRAQRAHDYILFDLGLAYSLRPTRDAEGTLRAQEGNCLSFANLLIALTREQGLNSFYVEVQNRQRFVYRDRSVISQGHIVAGLRMGGEMVLYENLPYSHPDYRRFKEIDDLTATAHYYNNLGAEALLDGNLSQAEALLRTAAAVDPTFVSGLSNLGICLTRLDRIPEAIEAYEQGLLVEPDNGTLISNLARAHQLSGNLEEAGLLLDQLEQIEHASPFFYVYRGEQALDHGDPAKALAYLREALKRSNEIPEVFLGLAKVYLALGELDKSRHFTQRALRLDATHEDARRFAKLLALGEGKENP